MHGACQFEKVFIFQSWTTWGSEIRTDNSPQVGRFHHGGRASSANVCPETDRRYSCSGHFRSTCSILKRTLGLGEAYSFGAIPISSRSNSSVVAWLTSALLGVTVRFREFLCA